ncbi:MAG: M15 family metallopeptidase [Cyanobacteria bacterium P01_C01_bin.89]
MDESAASKESESETDDIGFGRSLSQTASGRRSRISTEVAEAVRDGGYPATKKSRKGGLGWLLGTLALVFAGIAAMALWAWSTGQLEDLLAGDLFAPKTPDVEEMSDPSASPTINADDLLGHLPYEEAPEDDLVAISADGLFLLRSAAAESFRELDQAARRDGISLAMISAFRSIAQQQQVFFDIKANRRQTPDERAEVSAPPGYSEHHTGYAIDLGDAAVPSVNLSESFEDTRAFEWLDRNAVQFNFELSFPRDNVQGIAYEPWHWRFVGDRHSLETFYKARYQVRPRPTSATSEGDADGSDEAED